MKRRVPDVRRASSRRLPLVVLLGALLLSVPAGWNAVQLWRRLPVQRVSRLQQQEIQAAFDRVNRALGSEAREALALRRASDTLTGAFTGMVEPEQLQSTVGTAVSALSKSRVGSLQQAAARMWLLERAGEPVENWWPSLRVSFEGMARANLAHYQQALVQHWAGAYEAVGIGPGTAYGLAEDLVGHPHGPFLQFFVERLRRVIHEREAAGDLSAAAACRKLLYRLLKQWAIEPGPAGLRLLAADLLADELETDAGAATAPEMQRIAQDLRAWRSAYRQAARRRPIATLAPHHQPAIAPAAYERLVARVALTTWLGSAALAVGVTALALAWTWLGAGRPVIHGRRVMLYAAIVVLVVVGAALAWIQLWPDSVREDLRADFSSVRYWWRHPFVAAGLTLTLVFVAGLLQRAPSGGKSHFLAHAGAVAAAAWLMLAVVLWSSAIAGESARRDYERATRAAHADEVAAMIGPDADRLLAGLREWQP
jgi:hypothetical protein